MTGKNHKYFDKTQLTNWKGSRDWIVQWTQWKLLGQQRTRCVQHSSQPELSRFHCSLPAARTISCPPYQAPTSVCGCYWQRVSSARSSHLKQPNRHIIGSHNTSHSSVTACSIAYKSIFFWTRASDGVESVTWPVMIILRIIWTSRHCI